MKNKSYFFEWTGINQNGKITGETSAFTLNLARFALSEQGIAILSIRKKPFLFLKPYEYISTRDITLFFRQLAILTQAGIPIVSACQILANTQKNKAFRLLIQSIQTHLQTGKSLSVSLQIYPNYFTPMTCQLIHLGEQTGAFDHVLVRIAQSQEKLAHLKQQLFQACLYPAVILCVTLIVTLFMLLFVIPRFADLFQNMHGQLPFFTSLMILISEKVRTYYWVMVIPMTGSFVAFSSLKKSQRLKLDFMLLKIPWIHSLLKKIIAVRFTRSLSLALATGMAITDALQLMAPTVGNQAYEAAIVRLHKELCRGQLLYYALQKEPLFSPLLIGMVQVGEESGRLDLMLEKIANLYESELDHFVSQLGKLLEPLIITILGVLIGSVVIAMYLPIFNLGTAI